jgi:hypothetical protein
MKRPSRLPSVEPESKATICLLVAGICIGLIMALFAPQIIHVFMRWYSAQDGSEMRVAQEMEHVIREERQKSEIEAKAIKICRAYQQGSEVAVSDIDEDRIFFCSTKRGMNAARIQM